MNEREAMDVINKTACISDKDYDTEGSIDSLGMIEVLTAIETASEKKIDININPNDREMVVMKTPRELVNKLKERGYII